MAKKLPEVRRLNPEQQLVVDHLHGPLRVGAVAGSGKTHALIERAATLVEKHRVSPGKILLISFSVNARKEMEKRLSERLPGVASGEICRTFHSIGLDIFREEIDQSNSWFLDTTGRLWRKAIRQGAKKLGFDLAAKGSRLNMKQVEKVASLAKTQMVISDRALRRLGRIEPALRKIAVDVADEFLADDVIGIMHAAEDIRETVGIEEDGMFQNFLTFDDMLFSTAMLLRQKNAREKWAHRWTFVMQDEVQDSNTVQDEIAEALCSSHRNYMVVGDPAQAVYSFRGAHPERMLAFPQTWPGATTVVMDRNYRSGIEVIDVANRVIASMPESTVIAKAMKCERKSRAHVACHAFLDEASEALAIAQNIKKHFDQGMPWKDQAILIRMNFMARAIEVALATTEVPYRIVSGESFFKMTEASIMLGYLRVALGRATVDDIETALSNPNRMLGKVYFEQLAAARTAKPDVPWLDLVTVPQLGRKQYEMVEDWQALIVQLGEEVRDGKSPHQVLINLVKIIALDDWLKSDNDGDNAPAENIQQVLAFAANYETSEGLLDAVDKILSHKKSSARLRNVVEVSTIHRYKGREASVVYMPNISSGRFPSARGDLLEERRLFYVGVTRAMDELWMSYPEFNSDDTVNSPSLFLAEAGVKPASGVDYDPGRKTQPTKVGTQMGLLI
jgi:DNA helicase-2/ATP-dependent DNA helicase PcrA